MSDSKLYLRNGCCELLTLINEVGLKLYIVSGGIKGVVSETFYILQMQQAKTIEDSLKFCMTPETYDIDIDNTLVAFGEPMIMTTNKHIYTTHEIHPEIKVGSNAIVMGDILEDYSIVKNLKLRNVLGIGFYNQFGETDKKELQAYMDTYDIVIANDGNLHHVVEIIKSIIGKGMDPEYRNSDDAAIELAELLN